MNIEIPTEISASDLEKNDQRALMFQMLYALDSHNYDIKLDYLVESFANNFQVIITSNSDVFKKVGKIVESKEELDIKVLPLISSNWRPERLGTITRLILRMGAWELLNSQLDAAIVINESIELAKCFAEKDAYKFVNGILDEFANRYKNINQKAVSL
ncbi:MAG: transcription antitermination factor NusB [Novosphingobium sp.]|nr:transcription antitermination factor NusB [Novosphingobium sp.]